MKRTGKKNRNIKKNRWFATLTKPTIIFLALVLIGVVGMVCAVLFVGNVSTVKLNEETYQYFGSGATEHSAGITLSNSNVNTVLRDGKEEYDIDVSPLYSKEDTKIYLPQRYAWHCVEDETNWCVQELSCLVYDEKINVAKCIRGKNESEISGGFLYGAEQTYIFLDSGKVTIDDKTYDVDPMSFYSESAGMIRVYNCKTQQFEVLAESYNSIYTSDLGYTINLKRGIYTAGSGESMLLVSSPDVLDNIEERNK